MDLPYPLREELLFYMRVFNDYNDFQILPWHETGEDLGRYFPIRKTALRLMLREKNDQQYEKYVSESKTKKQHPNNNKDNNEKKKEKSSHDIGFRNTQRTISNRRKTGPGQERYTETIHNTAEFLVPDYEDVKNWDEKTSWMKYALPAELDEWYKKHPEDKPEGWVSPVREDTEQEKKDSVEQIKKEMADRKRRQRNPFVT